MNLGQAKQGDRVRLGRHRATVISRGPRKGMRKIRYHRQKLKGWMWPTSEGRLPVSTECKLIAQGR
jgi:hypothetical protein